MSSMTLIVTVTKLMKAMRCWTFIVKTLLVARLIFSLNVVLARGVRPPPTTTRPTVAYARFSMRMKHTWEGRV